MKDIGETLLMKIVDFYGWNKIISGEVESYNEYGLPEGIGEITIKKFISNYRNNIQLMNMITSDTRYHFSQINNKTHVVEAVGSVCFTGSLNTMSRTQASKLAESKGYQVKSSVTKGLTYLVTNDKFSGSSKNKKAQTLGIKIINENEFIILMSDNVMCVDDL